MNGRNIINVANMVPLSGRESCSRGSQRESRGIIPRVKRYERRLALQKRRHESKFGLEYLMEEKKFDRADPSAEIETAINRRDLEAE